MSRALTLALVQLEVELLAALRALEERDEKAVEAFLVAAYISLLELKDTLVLKIASLTKGLVEEMDGPKGGLPVGARPLPGLGQNPKPFGLGGLPQGTVKDGEGHWRIHQLGQKQGRGEVHRIVPPEPVGHRQVRGPARQGLGEGEVDQVRPVLGKGLDRTPKPTRCQNTHPLSLGQGCRYLHPSDEGRGQGLRLGGPGRHLLRTLLRYIPLYQSAGVQVEDHPRSSRRRSATGRLLALATGLRGRGFWPDQRTTPTWARPLRASRGSGDRGTSRPMGLPLSVTTRTLPALTKRR